MRCVVGALGLLFAPVLPAQEVVRTLVVRHRPAADLVSVLQPLAGPGGVVTSLDDRLIVRATPAGLERIMATLAEVDVAPRALWITVRHALGSSRSGSAAAGAVALGASPRAEGTRVELSPDGTRVVTSRSRVVVSGGFASSGVQAAGAEVQQVRALEGRPAFISAGIARPALPGTALGTGSTVVAGTPGYVEAPSELWVLPRVSGEVVTLEVATSKDAFPADSADMETRHVATTVSGRLGEWLPMGGIASSASSEARGAVADVKRNMAGHWTVDVKVDLVRE